MVAWAANSERVVGDSYKGMGGLARSIPEVAIATGMSRPPPGTSAVSAFPVHMNSEIPKTSFSDNLT